MKKSLLILPFVLLSIVATKAQQLPIYRQHYLNPSVLNPAFNGISNFTEVNLSYRQQWLGVDGSPEVLGLNIQLPTHKKLFFGFDLYSEEVVLLRQSSAVLTMGYALPLSTDHELRFAISGGVGLNSLDLSEEELNTNDQTILLAMENNYYVDGRFGLVYRYKNLQLGASLPQLFSVNAFTNREFNEVEFSELDYRIFFGSYRFNFTPTLSIKPQVIFTQNSGIDEFSGAAGLHYKDLLWVGASYQNTVGAFAGVQVNNIRIQYNYEMSSFPGSAFDNASHGIQLSIKLGKNKKNEVIKGSSNLEPAYTDSTAVAKNEVEEPSEPEIEVEIDTEPLNETLEEQEIKPEEAQVAIEKEPMKEEVVVEEEIVEEVEDEPVNYEDISIDDPGFDNGLMDRKGGLSMKQGFYVIVGVFKIIDNAINRSRVVMDLGYQSDMVINPKNDFYYVFVYYDSENQEKARQIRKEFRKKKGFRDAWLMEVN